MVRNSLKILAEKGNEYAQQVQLGLPDGTRATISNVYLPPRPSLDRRHISNAEARAAVADILTSAPASHYTLACGDFNTRIGTRAPTIGHV